MLSEKDVLKVSKLAKIDVSSDLEKYSFELNQILDSIEKIENSNIEGDIMISPNQEKNRFFNDIDSVTLSKNEIFKNSVSNDGNYIIVPRVR